MGSNPNPRIRSLASALAEHGLDAFFAQTAVSMGYLHGLHENAHERFLTMAINAGGDMRLIAPALTETQARRCGITDIRVWKDGEEPGLLFEELATEWGLKSGILAVDDDMPSHMLLKMQSVLPAALYKPGGAVLASLMSRKDADELARLRAAARIADDAFIEVAPKVRAGMTELEVEDLLVNAMKARGGSPFFCIVAAGSNAAEPHHLSDSTRLKEGDAVILDFGCDYGGYKSDITRTVAIGSPETEAATVYDIVYRAHRAGRAAAKPGVSGETVDRAAREVIEGAGYGEWFFHRTGHGLGMKGHEEPNIVVGNAEPLKPGNVFSIEPGIYLPGRFGVRIENIVTVTEDGCESLNDEPSPTLTSVS